MTRSQHCAFLAKALKNASLKGTDITSGIDASASYYYIRIPGKYRVEFQLFPENMYIGSTRIEAIEDLYSLAFAYLRIQESENLTLKDFPELRKYAD